ncbi:MAG: class D sortase [Acidobacteriota bacterium]
MKWLGRGEIAFSLIGVSFVGWALAAIVTTHLYQARQGRAFSDIEHGAAAAAHGTETPETPAASAATEPFAPARGADPLVLGRIEIPRIGVSAIVREGDDDATLAVAVGHIPGTARPGTAGNMALAGHRDSFFRALRLIKVQDTIRIRTAGGRYEYRVESTEVVQPGETRVLAPTHDAVLTLVTCYPFGWVGAAPDRFIVRARLSPQ